MWGKNVKEFKSVKKMYIVREKSEGIQMCEEYVKFEGIQKCEENV